MQNFLNNVWRIKIDENENPYGVPDGVLSALRNIKKEEISYFLSSKNLLEKLACFFSFEEENIFFSSSRLEILKYFFEVYLEENDKFLALEPFWVSSFEKVFKKYLKNIEFLKREKNIQIDFDFILSSIKPNTKIVYLSTPDEFSGEFIKPSFVRHLAQEFKNTKFIIDCSYINFAKNAAIADFIDISKELSNVYIMKTFSFDYGLFGFPFCVLLGKKETIKEFFEISPNKNLNLATNAALISAINDEKYIENVFEKNLEAKKAFFEGLLELGFFPKWGEGNFLLCDFSFCSDFYFNKLKNNGVLVKNFFEKENDKFKNFLRLSVPSLGGVKFVLELLNKKDTLILNLFDSLIDFSKDGEEKLLLKEEVLENLALKFNLVFYCQKEKFKNFDIEKIFKKLNLEKYFCLSCFDLNQELDNPDGILNLYNKIPKESENEKEAQKTYFLSDNIEGTICANKAQKAPLGIIPLNKDLNYMYNNFKHLGVRKILDDIKNLEDFLNF